MHTSSLLAPGWLHCDMFDHIIITLRIRNWMRFGSGNFERCVKNLPQSLKATILDNLFMWVDAEDVVTARAALAAARSALDTMLESDPARAQVGALQVELTCIHSICCEALSESVASKPAQQNGS